jgi:hypothetical protein
MSHWAQIDENNIVTQVLVGPNYGDEGEAFFERTWRYLGQDKLQRQHS